MKKNIQTAFAAIALILITLPILRGQDKAKAFDDKFRQLEEILPTPNTYRTGSGAPGHEYWQQQADYKMKLELNDEKQQIFGEETITYTNNSPDALTYLWLQLDQNNFEKGGIASKVNQNKIDEKMTAGQMAVLDPQTDYGFKVDWVKDAMDKDLPHTIVETMMRVDMPKPLRKGEKFVFKVKWMFNIVDRLKTNARSGWEYFSEENNYLYCIAQQNPRMCVYSDVTGWQHKQFLGTGEFTLVFGNYEVALTVPADHIVGATGSLQNPTQVLTTAQIERFNKAKTTYDNPIVIVTEAEAREAEKAKATAKKTWVFKAENVRDFAFCSSRKFIWDAMAVKQDNGTAPLAMSYYPKEGNPLWEKYSTKAVAHTLKWYSHHTFPYPYPVAISVHTDRIGMEYPMICFNGGRPEKDGTYSERTKYGMISVIIHEVGHNYFPMIVNSDERQWTWMDEGLNSFLQYLAEQQWERDYKSRRGPAAEIVEYMKSDFSKLEPIMTNSESVKQLGNNAYAKPTAALNILRETVMGRELFDYAFKTYANRWMFKHPMPSDFFRTMEDASGVDLDWFWRGWFYTTDNVDIAIDKVKIFRVDTKNPDVEFTAKKDESKAKARGITSIRNEKDIKKTQDETDPSIRDYYSDDDEFQVTVLDKEEYQKYVATLGKEEKALLESGFNFYEITFEMKGDLVSPIVVELQYTDGTKDYHKIPAEIWRTGIRKATKVFKTSKELKQVVIDPYLETADVDMNNNFFPPKPQMSRFELFKRGNNNQFGGGENPMQRMKRVKEKEKPASGGGGK